MNHLENQAQLDNAIEQQQVPQSDMAAASAAMDGVAAAALRSVLQRVQQAAERAGRGSQQIRVVAVSKTKPVAVIRQVYDAGHRCFGENYVQELVEKAPQLPEDIEWHFIGNLQSNKVKPLLSGVPNLAMIESVDDEKVKASGNVKCKTQYFRLPLHLHMQLPWTSSPSPCAAPSIKHPSNSSMYIYSL